MPGRSVARRRDERRVAAPSPRGFSDCRRGGLPLACVVGGGYAPSLDALVRRHAILHEVAHDLAYRLAKEAYKL